MATVNFIAQPDGQSTADAISQALQQLDVERMDIAAAYMTTSGVGVLLPILNRRTASPDRNVIKRWITSFDYCRTDPLALEAVLSLPSSSVRIFGADACLANNGVPKVPFHPKTFIFHASQCDCVLAGSGNISRSGLSRGVEMGLVVGVNRSSGTEEPSAIGAIDGLRQAFDARWNDSTPLLPAVLARYKSLYERADRLKNAVPTEDDIATSDNARGSLSSDDLKKLRICRNLWIQAGNITKNRGKFYPGNQLMMKRLSRVFFGFESTAIPENTLIGNVSLSFNRGPYDDYSVTHSDNKMDKLVLPIPGSGGPPAYDGETLLFQQVKLNSFRLSIGTAHDKMTWLRKSRAIDGAFRMSSGREWGVF